MSQENPKASLQSEGKSTITGWITIVAGVIVALFFCAIGTIAMVFVHGMHLQDGNEVLLTTGAGVAVGIGIAVFGAKMVRQAMSTRRMGRRD